MEHAINGLIRRLQIAYYMAALYGATHDEACAVMRSSAQKSLRAGLVPSHLLLHANAFVKSDNPLELSERTQALFATKR